MDKFKQAIAVMIAYMAQLPESHKDVVEAADRCFDHIANEVTTIRYIENVRRRTDYLARIRAEYDAAGLELGHFAFSLRWPRAADEDHATLPGYDAGAPTN